MLVVVSMQCTIDLPMPVTGSMFTDTSDLIITVTSIVKQENKKEDLEQIFLDFFAQQQQNATCLIVKR